MSESDVYYPDKPESRLHGLFAVFFYISLSLLVLAFACDFLNGLDDFLHAPIGIKDDPPEPGLIVQFAQFLWVPLGLSTLLFGYLSFMSRMFKAVPLLLGTLIVGCGAVSLVGGSLGEYKGHELFSGQAYFTQTITPVLYVIFLMSWVGVGAYRCVEKWKRGDQKLRYGLTGLLLIIALAFGLVGLVRGAVFNDSSVMLLVYGILIALLGYIIYIAPGKW